MARDISIAISAKDNFTQAITTMRNANQAFKKDLTGLQQKLDLLNKNKITLKLEVDKAKAALKEAEKQFLATGDAADKLKLELANVEYENVRRNLDLVSKNARQAEKDILNLTNAISKADNRAGSVSEKGLLGTLASAGLTKLVGDTLAGTANTLVSSAFGSAAGSMFSNILSSAAMGAAMGSLAGPPGTVIGAAVGGITGAISGATRIYEEKDSAFKEYYKNQYDTLLEAQNEILKSGIETAAQREQDLMAFITLLGGSENARSFLQELTDFAARTPFGYEDLTTISRTLLAYGYQQSELLPMLEVVGDAGAALGMSKEDMKYVATALGRMRTTGKTTMEYLNPLLERGIDVWGYLAEASGKTKKEVQEMVSKGLVPGEEAAKSIADYLAYDFGGAMEDLAHTYSGLVSTLQDNLNELNKSMGEGYIEERKRGIQEEISYLGGTGGLMMQKAYKQIGQWKASLENLSEQYEREAITAVMTGTISSLFSDEARKRLNEMYVEYIKYASDPSEEVGAKMGALLAEAQAIAQNEYNASEGAQLLLQTQKGIAENIKNDAGLKEAYWNAGYEMGLQFSKGLVSAVKANTETEELHPWTAAGMSASDYGRLKAYEAAHGYAYGISYVPYDNYPTILHEGERVLTASENRNYGKGTSAVITGNNFYIREEADIERVAKEIVKQLIKARALT